MPAYWLHLAAPADARLAEVDEFLRDIWLECCGHLSAFNFRGRQAISSLDPDFEPLWDDQEDMSAQLKEVLQPGTVFDYEYDFGSTTELRLKVLGVIEAAAGEVRLLARNDQPRILCDACGKSPAMKICTECQGNGGWFCDGCAEEHECDPTFLLPVVNSPRTGVCAYGG
jgi:hypothetical protein